MSRTIPELALPFLNFLTIPAGGRLTRVRFRVNQTHIHGGSSVESGFEPGALRLRSQDVTIKQPRTFFFTFEATMGNKKEPHHFQLLWTNMTSPDRVIHDRCTRFKSIHYESLRSPHSPISSLNHVYSKSPPPNKSIPPVLIYGPAVQMERWISGPVGYPTFCSNFDPLFTLTTCCGMVRLNMLGMERS
ncbi:hypothetical protein AVEN_12653-1 [Araneus ventricosus]|uniref:Uncharacterized protein n=1 Tax=Araneus ventricosus TaxID=182803 RepID=A0A4Y2AB00_ARAVE|nr:hypothetical protein AVEN_12653-1 [Araneus ventricosus]